MLQFNHTQQDILRLRNNGEYFGYPKCCIDHFILGKYKSEEQILLLKKIDTKGFLPCPSCSLKILYNEITIDFLIKNRKHHKPLISNKKIVNKIININ
jgi:hypothetical protein